MTAEDQTHGVTRGCVLRVRRRRRNRRRRRRAPTTSPSARRTRRTTPTRFQWRARAFHRRQRSLLFPYRSASALLFSNRDRGRCGVRRADAPDFHYSPPGELSLPAPHLERLARGGAVRSRRRSSPGAGRPDTLLRRRRQPPAAPRRRNHPSRARRTAWRARARAPLRATSARRSGSADVPHRGFVPVIPGPFEGVDRVADHHGNALRELVPVAPAAAAGRGARPSSSPPSPPP